MTTTKNLGLEGLRGIACLIVAIGHFAFVFFPYLGTLFSPIPGQTPRFSFEHLVQYPPFSIAYSAEAAVCVFFVMSGYVLTTKYFSTNDISALQVAAAKRYVRLVLPAFVSVMIAWVLWRTGAIISKDSAPIGVAGWVPAHYVGPFPFAATLFNGLVGAPLFGHVEMNGVLWTIQVELIGSVMLFALLAAFGRNPFWLCVWFLFFANVLGYSKPNALFYISFLAGAFLNLARDWLKSHQGVSTLFVLLGAIGFAFNHHPWFRFIQAIPLPNLQPYGPDFETNARLFWNTIGAVLLVAGVLGSRAIGAIFATRVPVFLGKISFSLYVLHWPILMSIGLATSRFAQAQGMSYGASAALSFSVFIPAAVASAALFERYVDRPSIKLAAFLSRRKSRSKSRQPEVIQAMKTPMPNNLDT